MGHFDGLFSGHFGPFQFAIVLKNGRSIEKYRKYATQKKTQDSILECTGVKLICPDYYKSDRKNFFDS